MIKETLTCSKHKTVLPTLNQCENEHGTVEKHYTIVNLKTKETVVGKFIANINECSTDCLFRELGYDKNTWEVYRWTYKFH